MKRPRIPSSRSAAALIEAEDAPERWLHVEPARDLGIEHAEIAIVQRAKFR
jgi:hypothetical protein